MRLLPGFTSLGAIWILCPKAVRLATCTMKLLLVLASTFTELHDKPRVPGLLSTNHGPPSLDQSRRQLQRERRSGRHCPCAQPAVARQDAILQLRASLLQPCCVLVAPLRSLRLHVLFGVLAHLRVPPQEVSAKSGHCLVTQAVAAQLRLLPRAVAPLCGPVPRVWPPQRQVGLVPASAVTGEKVHEKNVNMLKINNFVLKFTLP